MVLAPAMSSFFLINSEHFQCLARGVSMPLSMMDEPQTHMHLSLVIIGLSATFYPNRSSQLPSPSIHQSCRGLPSGRQPNLHGSPRCGHCSRHPSRTSGLDLLNQQITVCILGRAAAQRSGMCSSLACLASLHPHSSHSELLTGNLKVSMTLYTQQAPGTTFKSRQALD